MKRHLSIWMLMARSTAYKVLGLFLALIAADGALFAWALRQTEQRMNPGVLDMTEDWIAPSLEHALEGSYFSLAFGVCLLALTAVLCLTGCEFSAKQGYTLRRLRVSQREIFVWQMVHNAVCYFLLWAVQAGIAFAVCRAYTVRYPDWVSGQTVFLAFYRDSFLHSLLPLADGWRYVRNAVLCVTLGMCTAAFPVLQRQGKKSIGAVILPVTTAVYFGQPIASGDFEIIVVALLVTVLAMIRALEVSKDEA